MQLVLLSQLLRQLTTPCAEALDHRLLCLLDVGIVCHGGCVWAWGLGVRLVGLSWSLDKGRGYCSYINKSSCLNCLQKQLRVTHEWQNRNKNKEMR